MSSKIKISEIAFKVTSGGTPRTTNSNYYDGDIPWLRTQEVNFSRIYRTEKTITEEGLNNSSAKMIPKNSVIVAMYGATAGKVAINKIELSTNQACCNIVVNSDKADYEYVYYALKNEYKNLLNSATGAAQQNLGTNQISNFKILFYPIEKQKEIAKILGDLDQKIELNRKMNETLEQIGRALFKKHFVDDEENNKWSLTHLGSMITPRRGNSLLRRNMKEGNVAVVSGGLEPSGYSDKSNTTAPVITISASGANAGFVRLWNDHIWSADSSFIDKTVSEHVYFFYIFLKIKQDEIYSMQTGAAQPHIYPSHLERLEIKNIPEEKIEEFSRLVEPLFIKIGNLDKEIKTLVGLRDSILPKLMSGQISI